jgi:hypothetical protein
MTPEAFNPLAIDSLAHSIVTRMTEMIPVPLNDVPLFTGAGLYAIYYRGAFPVYADLVAINTPTATVPIYVGKAVPAGGRKGVGTAASGETKVLANRVREHAKSVRAAINLDIADFVARWLVVEDIWIPLGESAMIRRHRPVWNVIVDGFGNHDPGSGRGEGVRSRWDTLHPGRSWADKYPKREETPAHIEQEIREYLRSRLA